MKALVLKANADLQLENRPIPYEPEKGTLLVKIAACGICGSDIPRGFQNGAYFHPLVMGHEFSGIVEEEVLGSKFNKGDRVAVFPLIPTDISETAYQSGNYALCKSYGGSTHVSFLSNSIYGTTTSSNDCPPWLTIICLACVNAFLLGASNG